MPSPDVSAENPPVRCKSEGQRLLLAVGKGPTELAKELRLTKGAVSHWFTGSRAPKGDLARELESRYAIPVRSWHEIPADRRRPARPPRQEPAPDQTCTDEAKCAQPVQEPVSPAVETPAPRKGPGRPSTRKSWGGPAQAQAKPSAADLTEAPPLPQLQVEDPLAGVRALVERCRAGIMLQGLTASEAKSWNDQLLAAMKMAQTIADAQEVRDDTLARSPAWTRLRDKILNALEEHPAALAAVVAAINGGR